MRRSLLSRALLLSLLTAHALPKPPTTGEALALALPDDATHTKLVLQPRTLEWLRSLHGPVSIVGAIGAYRSGKSFLLNSLMGVSCADGFMVGHQRQTQTKGVWLWSTPRAMSNVSVVYMDTEGFESTGQADVYDDRSFALATLISTVLVYNLVETIRQADIERLAFAATLSQEFWRRAQKKAAAGGGGGGEWAPPALLWLVQRDFLEGGSVDAYLREALKPADNPADDEHVGRLNRVREALGVFEAMRGMGLPQPHLQRTQLCSLPRSALAPEYLAAQGRLESYVEEQATRSRRPLDGRALAALASQFVEALNAQQLPSAASVLDAFNEALVAKAVRALQAEVAALPLPMGEGALQAELARRLAAAEAELAEQSLGASGTDDLRKAAAAVLKSAADANFVASQRVCDAVWERCDGRVRRLATSWLPSQRRFAAGLADCNASATRCAGAGGARAAARRPGGAREGGVRGEVLLAARARDLGRRRRRARRALRRALVAVGALWRLAANELGARLDPFGSGCSCWSRHAASSSSTLMSASVQRDVGPRAGAARRRRAPHRRRPPPPLRAQRQAAAEGGGVGGCCDKVGLICVDQSLTRKRNPMSLLHVPSLWRALAPQTPSRPRSLRVEHLEPGELGGAAGLLDAARVVSRTARTTGPHASQSTVPPARSRSPPGR